VNASAFNDEDIERYVAAMRQPGALTAAMSYYRAAFRGALRLSLKARRRIESETLVIWGERDRYLGSHLLDGTDSFVPQLRIERIPDASHWVQSDAPQRVNELLLDFLQRPLPNTQPKPNVP
jgi:pimeloyl-ACP methyl ester carboxylesterase